MPMRTSTSMRNLNVVNILSTESTFETFINPINTYDEQIVLEKMGFNFMGTILKAFQITNFLGQDLMVDFYRSRGTFDFNTECTPDDGPWTGEVLFNNLTTYYSQNKMNTLNGQGFFYSGPMNFTMQNSFLGAYVKSQDGRRFWNMKTPEKCLVDDEEDQFILIENVHH